MSVALFLAIVLSGGNMALNEQVATSSGQSGGVTAYSVGTLNYYNQPPVTEQERAIALERLRLTLNDLAIYNQRPAELGQLSVLEATRTEHIARRLYLILSSFFDATILQANNGKSLIVFKRSYTQFVRNEIHQEQRSLEYLGKSGPTKMGGAWGPLLQYAVLRAFRGSKDATVASGIMLVDATPDQAEELYTKFISDPEGGSWLAPAIEEQEKLIASASSLLAPFAQE